jgi:glycerol-3-phosphate dehydrogenase
MRREELIPSLRGGPPRDVLVIGGGATGLGCAVDAASRGYDTLLLEQGDFGHGTSSRSTKLIHGGVRYLRQGHIRLVKEALRERGLLLRNAPHAVRRQPFLIPLYARWEGPFYAMGLSLYDRLAGPWALGRTLRLSRRETMGLVPTLEPRGLRGGVLYEDAQFDDARLAILLARTLADLGGVPLNYVRVTGFLKASGRICGVRAEDRESREAFEILARVVVNAAGVQADAVSSLDDLDAVQRIAPSRGSHVVLPASFLNSPAALLVPRTDDGRVIFAIPWMGRVLVGTTDVAVESDFEEPRATETEIDLLLEHAGRYLTSKPRRDDVLSAFAGLRPLVRRGARRTSALSRDHVVNVSASGLVSVLGGKWTTYRRMGRDAVETAAASAKLAAAPSRTESLRLHGFSEGDGGRHGSGDWHGTGDRYGSDAALVDNLIASTDGAARPLHPLLPYREGDVLWAARYEMARTVEDVLARRTRALFLDAAASLACAPRVAEILASELRTDAAWAEGEVKRYADVARSHT